MARRTGSRSRCVVRHSVGLAQGAGGHGVAVHELEHGRLAAQIAVRRLAPHQILQAAANVVAVGAVEVRMAGAEKRQQRQSGHGRVGPAAGVLTVSAQHVGLLAGVVGSRVPAAVGGLIVGQPFQGGLDRGLGFGRAAVTLRHAGPIGRHAKPIGVGQRLLGIVAAGRTLGGSPIFGDADPRGRTLDPTSSPSSASGQTGNRRRGQPIRSGARTPVPPSAGLALPVISRLRRQGL